MKRYFLKLGFFLAFLAKNLAVFAQDNLKQTSNDIKYWFTQNWQWVVGGALVLLLIIVALSSRRANRKTTTIVKDDRGNVKSITSTEIRE